MILFLTITEYDRKIFNYFYIARYIVTITKFYSEFRLTCLHHWIKKNNKGEKTVFLLCLNS